MIFAKTPITAFRPETQEVLQRLDEAVRENMRNNGTAFDEHLTVSHFATNQMFDPEIFYEQDLGDLLRFESIEFVAAYLADTDQSLGWDSFMIFIGDYASEFTTELSFERSKGGLSSLLSRLQLSDEKARYRCLQALVKWNNDNYLVLNDHDPGRLVQALHLDITSRFLDESVGKGAPAGVAVLPTLHNQSPYYAVFHAVTDADIKDFSADAYKAGIQQMINPRCEGHSLNNLIPHLLYDPVVLMCERGDGTYEIIKRISLAFDALLGSLEAPEVSKKALFEQMLYNAFSLYPERLASLGLSSAFELGNHPWLEDIESFQPLVRILSGPLGAFVSDMQCDLDSYRQEALGLVGIHSVLGMLDSHLVRTPAVGYLSLIREHEDVVMLDYHLEAGNLAPETIHYCLKQIISRASELSKPALVNLVLGEVEFLIAHDQEDRYDFQTLGKLISSDSDISRGILDGLEAMMGADGLIDRVSAVAQHLDVLSADALRGHRIGGKAQVRERLFSQDLGL